MAVHQSIYGIEESFLFCREGGFVSYCYWAWYPSETCFRHSSSYAISDLRSFKYVKKLNSSVFETSDEFFFALWKSNETKVAEEYCWAKTGGRVAMLPPIRLSCVEVWISAALPCSPEYEGGTQSHEHINYTIMERYEWASITCQVAALYSLLCEIRMPLDVLLAPFWKSENPLAVEHRYSSSHGRKCCRRQVHQRQRIHCNQWGLSHGRLSA